MAQYYVITKLFASSWPRTPPTTVTVTSSSSISLSNVVLRHGYGRLATSSRILPCDYLLFKQLKEICSRFTPVGTWRCTPENLNIFLCYYRSGLTWTLSNGYFVTLITKCYISDDILGTLKHNVDKLDAFIVEFSDL